MTVSCKWRCDSCRATVRTTLICPPYNLNIANELMGEAENAKRLHDDASPTCGTTPILRELTTAD